MSFLANTDGKYMGRTCHWKDCRPGIRIACDALNCGRVQYLHDDLQVVKINSDQIASPPLIVYPKYVMNSTVPTDLRDEANRRFETGVAGSS